MRPVVLALHTCRCSVWDRQVAGLDRFCRARGWAVRDACLGASPDMGAVRRLCADARVVGVISSLPVRLTSAVRAGRPLVCFDCPSAAVPTDVPYLRHDAEATARLAGHALFPLDCAAYAYVHVSERPYWSRERCAAFRREVAAGGRAFAGAFGEADGEAPFAGALRRWLGALPRPCGIFAANDEMALRLMAVARRAGLRVPQDVALVGVDDSARCVKVTPTLTSVAPDWEAGAFLAAETLDRLLAGRPVESRLTFRPLGLVSRASTRRNARAGDGCVVAGVAFIRENACAGITVRDVVRTMGCSRRRAEVSFRAVTGRSILEEIRRIRFEQARLLVRSGVTSEAAVANRCGYASLPTFARTFRELHGMTFTDWVRKEKR